jgi:ribose transport system permease protein
MSTFLLRAGRVRQLAPQFADWRELLAALLPGIALVAMLVWAQSLQSQAITYDGLNLLLSSAVPLLLAALSQMFIIVLGDIDLGTGYLVGLANVVAARWLAHKPLLAIAIFIGLVLAYALQGVLVHVRRIPSIIVTLGSSFIWLGCGLLVLSIPGGSSPAWLSSFFNAAPPLVPLPIWIAGGVALLAYAISFLLPYGAVIRGTGSNDTAVARSGWSIITVRVVSYGLAAIFGVLSGLALTGITGSGDSSASANFTLLAIAAVILGGGEFAGGRSVPVGAVIGALALSLVGPVLGLLNVSSDYQTGAQGLVLIVVLAGRAITKRVEQ